MLEDSWQLVGSVSFNHPHRDLTVGLFRLLNNPIIKIKSVSSTRNEWRRAAYMKQVINKAEVDNRIVPLNQETIFELSPLPGQYSLIFTPIRWLPDLVLWIWEYTGKVDDVKSDLTRIESKIDNLAS